ncbi:MAG: alkyl hydroperoxide reductase [candidate division Zixibacteria bacterium RBG_16_40_9]|nr:MAG: alkyl hydroperoxide reductase [candidate division Zixibacteria bacterium RBG_16_40_9]
MAEATLKEGDPAPDFNLPSSLGKNISLKDYRDKKIILYFYPKDDTPGCTKEACSFRDDLKKYEKVDAIILGVSSDDLDSHRKFIEKYNLPFPLLSDTDSSVSKAYGVYKLKNMYGKEFWGIERTTFLIDEKCRIEKIFPKVKVDGHSEELLRLLKN